MTDNEKFIGQKIRENSLKLNEYEEMISINISIVKRLREKGMIAEDDPEYLEILNIRKDNHAGYKNFLLNRMPGYLGYGRNKKLEEEFMSWINKFLSQLRAEDKILKKYIDANPKHTADAKAKAKGKTKAKAKAEP